MGERRRLTRCYIVRFLFLYQQLLHELKKKRNLDHYSTGTRVPFALSPLALALRLTQQKHVANRR